MEETQPERGGQQERGRGVVREICVYIDVSEKHGCVQKNDSVRHVGGSAGAKQLVTFNTKQTNHTTGLR